MWSSHVSRILEMRNGGVSTNLQEVGVELGVLFCLHPVFENSRRLEVCVRLSTRRKKRTANAGVKKEA